MGNDEVEEGAQPPAEGESEPSGPAVVTRPGRRASRQPPEPERADPARPALRLSELPEVPADRYRLGAEIGRGGVGRVVEARDLRLDRVVAIKELVLDSPRVAARFLQEASIAARLQHPSIVPIYESGRWRDGSAFYAMKLVRGQTLAEAISSARDFEERTALIGHVLRAADAMGYAHSEHVIHRDLKPANVLVGPFQETVIIDWGLAKVLHEHATSTLADEITSPAGVRESSGWRDTLDGEVIGTPSYMPPEQAAGASVDPRADVYALGAMLYQVLAGQRPYAASTGSEVLDRLGQGPPQPLEELVPQVPRDLVAIVDKAMARDPAERYATAAEMATELRRYATGNLVGAHDYSTWELFARFVARRRGILITALAGLLVALGLGVWSFQNVSRQKSRAEIAARRADAARRDAEKAAAEREQERALAVTRMNESILERARALLESDPTGSVAALKILREPLPLASSIAAEAEERGVARHVIAAHDSEVEVLVASQNGRFIASGGRDGSIHLWDDANQRGHRLGGHTRRITALAFSEDGRRLVSGSRDATVRVWNLDHPGEETSRVFVADGPVRSVAHAPDRPLVASLDDRALRLWPLDGGQRRQFPLNAKEGATLSFSPRGKSLLSGPHGNELWAWDLATGEAKHLAHGAEPRGFAWLASGALISADREGRLRHFAAGGLQPSILPNAYVGEVTALAVAADGSRATVGGDSGKIALVELGAGRVTELGRHDGAITDLVMDARGQLVGSTGWDKTARLWNLETGDSRVLRGHSDVVSAAALSGRGSVFASGGWDGQLRLWPAKPPSSVALRGHGAGIHGVDFAQSSLFAASGGRDHSVRLWGMKTGEQQVLTGHTDNIFRVRISPGGRYVASTSDDRTVRLWDVQTLQARVLTGHEADVEEAHFSADGRLLITSSDDATARVWQVSGDGVQVLRGHTDHVTDVALDPAGRFAVTASRDETVRLWTLGSAEWRKLGQHPGPVHGVDVSPDGAWVASVGGQRLSLWPTGDGKAKTAALHMPGARHVTFSPKGTQLVVGGARPTLYRCDVPSLECEPLWGHSGTVWAVSFSPLDDDRLASASADNTVRIWDLAHGESRPLFGHDQPVFDVAFSGDGKTVVSGGADAVVRLWPSRPPPRREHLAAVVEQLTSFTE